MMSKSKKRSAWFAGIGSVIKQLFGNMDEDDAIKYSDAIKTLENDQSKLATLMKDSILVTESTLSSLKEIIDQITANEASLNHAIDTLTQDVINITLVTDKLLMRSKISALSDIIESTMLTLSFKLEDIINAIMFSKSNILYPSIITPKQLFADLVDNYRFLPSSKQLPVPLILDNIHILENVSDVSSYYADNKIIFVLQIPLVNTKEFDLYNTIPYPIELNAINSTLYSTIIPSTKYIGITKDKSSYCKLNSLSSCKVINSQYYICETPSVYSTSAVPICESEIISKALTSVPRICNTKFVNGNFETFHKLHRNQWIYILSQNSKLTIECNNQDLSEFAIHGTGILTIPEHCIAYCRDNKLVPQHSIVIKTKPIILHFEIINDSCCSPATYLKDNIKVPYVNLKNVNNLDSLLSNYNKITDQIKTNLNEVIEKPHIVLYGKFYSYVTIIISLVIVIAISYKLYTCLKTLKSSRCKPKPDNSVEMSSPDPEDIPVPRLRMT
ncbi:hypothetical protein PYW07_006587 [Mythimna separata]|uniref:Envelope protein n=1 Tax=Mythimna separata TaxID=271217 RepID=A0AAD7YTY2_MYTSE|nr:hypothetical protein PYW07_006587 [Mythimna separata]